MSLALLFHYLLLNIGLDVNPQFQHIHCVAIPTHHSLIILTIYEWHNLHM